MVPHFDPFQNRVCRNVRNDLSDSLMEALQAGDIGPVLAVAEKHTATAEAGPGLENYITTRVSRYLAVLKQIRSAGIKAAETYVVALLLWDQELFFEFHDWLEKEWLASMGTEKEILQGLIRAAGTYILRQHGRKKGARKMAARAITALDRHRERVPSLLNIKLLLDTLANPESGPPRLGADQIVNQRTRQSITGKERS